MPETPSALSPITTGDGSSTLYSARYGQTYGSSSGALREAREVFLENSGVAARLAAGESVRVLEVGFGTGLNFFVTAQACLEQPKARLDYTALEHTLLSAETVQRLGYEASVDRALVEAYLEWREHGDEPPGTHVFEASGVRLELLLGEATGQTLPKSSFYALYHDAFSPDVNPELWTEAFLSELVGALAPGGTLVSYCVQGVVRRALEALGLEVGKRPGPAGGKREVLVATKPQDAPA